MTGDCRAPAARALAQVMSGQSLNRVLPEQLETVSLKDRALLQQLCYGTLRMWPRLDALSRLLMDKALRSKDRDVQALILIGLYQLSDTRIPDHAAVASTVGATRALGKSWAKGLVNAVLRRYLRERGSLEQHLDASARSAHPAWLYQRLKQDWGDDADAIVVANNTRPPMTLRVNLARIDRNSYRARLSEAGLLSHPGQLAAGALYLEQPVDVDKLPGFASGLVSVQDEAAQLAVELLDPGPGERVLDACAAPGGKTCHCLERQPGLAELVALEVDAERAQRIRQNLDRLGLTADLLVADAGRPPAALAAASYDRILVDAPCSASGVIRRHPDIKLLRREADITQLAAGQGRILDGLWPLLKPGGFMLYVTCSVLEEENSAVIEHFLAHQPQARRQLPAVTWGRARSGGRQLLPRVGGPDGLFFAGLTRLP